MRTGRTEKNGGSDFPFLQLFLLFHQRHGVVMDSVGDLETQSGAGDQRSQPSTRIEKVVAVLVWLVNPFYAFSWPGFFLYLLNAIIRGVTGYLLIRRPDAGAEGVTRLLAAFFILGGLFRGVGASVIQFPR